MDIGSEKQKQVSKNIYCIFEKKKKQEPIVYTVLKMLHAYTIPGWVAAGLDQIFFRNKEEFTPRTWLRLSLRFVDS